MTLIQNIESRELLDSQGNATLECDVMLECGALGRATAVVGVPNDKRDDDPKRFWGKGVGMALSNVRDLVATQLRGMDSLNQAGVDLTLENLDSIGGNSSLAFSLSVAQAA
ncbi:MAG: phosphopyruvate hydratase, partial [Lentisphaeria bacterium]|nr:phosphopyruvate hydratase [Lentisphaeria bacterium]